MTKEKETLEESSKKLPKDGKVVRESIGRSLYDLMHIFSEIDTK